MKNKLIFSVIFGISTNLTAQNLVVSESELLPVFEEDHNLTEIEINQSIGLGTDMIDDDKSNPDSKASLWPSGIVPVRTDSESAHDTEFITNIQNAIYQISIKTGIIFVEAGSSDEDFIEFTREKPGCFSKVGRKSGGQKLNIGKSCNRVGIIMHELFHALGMRHEQSRSDRDQHVRIFWDNIIPEKKHNFRRIASGRMSDYDYKSIMHYGSYSFSKNGQPTILTIDDEEIKANRSYLTPYDVRGICDLYNL